ncbi:MAG TPA: hypothetical protein VFU90_10460 [Candidatus Tumulicola sp.]|nr:hypothetical protein [Candidatus Tumulicola sp.]
MIDARTGKVQERLEMPAAVAVSGLESDGGDRFFCGGGSSGKVRVVRRPARHASPRDDANPAARCASQGDDASSAEQQARSRG